MDHGRPTLTAHCTLLSPSLPHRGVGPGLACVAQLQAVEASIPVTLQHLGQIWLLYLQHQAWLLSEQHRQDWESNRGSQGDARRAEEVGVGIRGMQGGPGRGSEGRSQGVRVGIREDEGWEGGTEDVSSRTSQGWEVSERCRNMAGASQFHPVQLSETQHRKASRGRLRERGLEGTPLFNILEMGSAGWRRQPRPETRPQVPYHQPQRQAHPPVAHNFQQRPSPAGM